jgi:hypothetical protein
MTTRGWFEATLQVAWAAVHRQLADGRPASFQDFLNACDNYIASEYGGMQLQKYGALGRDRAAAEREARVIDMVERGASPQDIAAAEHITPQHARRMKRRLRGSIGSR